MNRKDVRNEKAAEADVIAAMIRQWSKSGRLISELELRRQFIEGHQSPFPGPDDDMQPTLAGALQQHDDLHELRLDDSARYYYSSQDMTQGYASMLLQKQGDPARLIAEVVRENSVSYPRPVPLDMFTHPPFDLTREQVLDCSGTNERPGGVPRYCLHHHVGIHHIPLFDALPGAGACFHARRVVRRGPGGKPLKAFCRITCLLRAAKRKRGVCHEQQLPGAPHDPGDPQHPPAGSGEEKDGEPLATLWADINFTRSSLPHFLHARPSCVLRTRNSLTSPHFPHRYSKIGMISSSSLYDSWWPQLPVPWPPHACCSESSGSLPSFRRSMF